MIMSDLRLPLKEKWFKMTNPDEKTEDYREITPYWIKRLTVTQKDKGFVFKKFDNNIMTLGYPKSTDKSRIKKYKHAGIEIGNGKPEWGAEPGKLYFVIKHGEEVM